MSGKKKGNIADPDLHSSESPAKDGNELKNRINETAKYSELFEKIDVDSDYDDILATYEKTLDKRTRAAMKKAGGAQEHEIQKVKKQMVVVLIHSGMIQQRCY